MNIKGLAAVSSIKKLYRIFNDRQKRAFGWLVFFTFLASITDLLGLSFVIPVVGLVLSETFYNTVITHAPSLASFDKKELLLISVGALFVLILLKNAFGLYINWLQVKFVKNLFVTSSMNVLERVYDRSLPDIQKDSSNTLVNKITYLQISLCSNAAISTIIIINEAIIFTLTAVIVSVWDWKLFLLLIAVLLPIMGIFYSRVKNMIKDAGTQKSEHSTSLYARAQEMIYGYIDIKIAGTEGYFKERFRNLARNYTNYMGKMDFMLFVPTRIIEVAISLCIILIMLYGVYFMDSTEQLVTTITLFSVIAYRSIPSINRFMMAINNLNSNEFILDDPEFVSIMKQDKPENTAPILFKNKIEFQDVSYRYTLDTKMVIKDCNLTIRKGEKIGIIGKSGAGKSTLVSNILGFLEPTEGRIMVDDTKLTPENIKAWWQLVGYVRQEVFIMNATLKENIAIGIAKEQIDEEAMARAIRLASLTELVSDLPDGINTMLSERGNNLSGGQKQRVSIARAIYKGAQVLIFDEATSALDNKTEEEITNAIRQLGKEDLTIVIIAHRYTSLKYCDHIYQIDGGIVSSSFSYETLSAQQ